MSDERSFLCSLLLFQEESELLLRGKELAEELSGGFVVLSANNSDSVKEDVFIDFLRRALLVDLGDDLVSIYTGNTQL